MDVTQNQSIVQRYKILKEIGQGGMGRVYKAYDKNLDKEVAIKVLLAGEGADEKQKARFLREAQAILTLRHKNIISIYDVFSQPQLFFTMEYIDGCTLDKYREQHSRKQTIDILIKVAKAVHYMHENGIIHRDLKPSNILVTPEGEPVVMDFGLAKMMDSGGTLTKTGDVMGTVKYASPEQIFGKPTDKTSDIYSLGVILYEVAYKRSLFEAKSHENLLFAILNEKPEFTGNVAPDLQKICQKALAKDKEQRYENAAQFARDLRNFQNGTRTRSRTRQSSSLHVVGITTIVVVLLAGMIAIFSQSSNNTSSETIENSSEIVNSVAKQKADQYFAQYVISYDKHELQEAWEHLKNAIAENPRPAYYVHAWYLKLYLVCNSWDPHITQALKEQANREFSPMLTREFVESLKSSDDYLDIYSYALLQQLQNSATPTVLMERFEKCWKMSSFPQAAQRLLRLYYKHKSFAEVTQFFESVENKSACLYEDYAHFCNKQGKANSWYFSAVNKGHLNAMCSVASRKEEAFKPIADLGYVRAICAMSEITLEKRSDDAAQWLNKLRTKQHELLAYNFFELQGFLDSSVDKNKAKAQHHFENFRVLFDYSYIDLAWHEIKEAIRLDRENAVYYVYASQISIYVCNFLYKREKKNDMKQGEMAKTVSLVADLLPKNPQGGPGKFAKGLYLWYAKEKELAGPLLVESYEKYDVREAVPNVLGYYNELRRNKARKFCEQVIQRGDMVPRSILSCAKNFPKNEVINVYRKAAQLKGLNALCSFYDIAQRNNYNVWLSIARSDFFRAFSHLHRIDTMNRKYWQNHMNRKLREWASYKMDSLHR